MHYSSSKVVKDIMKTNPNYVYEDSLLSEMIAIMVREKVNELPVIDKDRKIIGEVNFLKVIAYYLKNTDS